MTPAQQEYWNDLLKFWAWLRAHPHTVSGAIWFVIGFVLGKML